MALDTDQQASKFETWVKGFGVSRLASAMTNRGTKCATSYSSVYMWLRGEHFPREAKIRAMIEISRGAINAQDVYNHFSKFRASRTADA